MIAFELINFKFYTVLYLIFFSFSCSMLFILLVFAFLVLSFNLILNTYIDLMYHRTKSCSSWNSNKINSNLRNNNNNNICRTTSWNAQQINADHFELQLQTQTQMQMQIMIMFIIMRWSYVELPFSWREGSLFSSSHHEKC